MSAFDNLAAEAHAAVGRLIRPSLITPILDHPYPAWYLDRDGRVLGANLLACQIWGADRPGDLYGQSALDIYANTSSIQPRDIPTLTWSQPIRLSIRRSRWETQSVPFTARLRLLEGDWGAVIEFEPAPESAADPAARATRETLHTWHKRAIRLWGGRSYVQYDAARFREYAFVLKEVELTRHRCRPDERAPHATLGLVRDALEQPDSLWKTASEIASRTDLPPSDVKAALRCLTDFGGDVVRAPMVSGGPRDGYATRAHLARVAPRWLRLASRLPL